MVIEDDGWVSVECSAFSGAIVEGDATSISVSLIDESVCSSTILLISVTEGASPVALATSMVFTAAESFNAASNFALLSASQSSHFHSSRCVRPYTRTSDSGQ